MADFDLNSYIEQYEGQTKLDRLMFIAEKSEELKPEALKLAKNILRDTLNTTLYKDVLEKLGEEDEDNWIEKTDRKAASHQNSLEMELNHALAGQDNAGARDAYSKIAHFHISRGELEACHKTFMKMREFSLLNDLMLTLCYNVVLVNLAQHKYNYVLSYITKSEVFLKPVTEKDEGYAEMNEMRSRMSCAGGIARLDRCSYLGAAQKFLEATSVDNQVMSMKDLVTYSGLCALATFSRTELKMQVLDNKRFMSLLDLAPSVRELILDFYGSRYSSALQYLAELEKQLKFDIYLSGHMTRLRSMIRHKALLQYFSPFAAVSLETMATTFNSDVDTIEKEVASLIMENQLDGKIDSHNKILYATEGEKRRTAFRHATTLAEDYEHNTHAMLLRINLMKNHFFVKPARMQMAGGGGGRMQQLMQMMMGGGGMGFGM